MAVVAPTTAGVAVAIPVLVSIGLGERPAQVAALGILLGIVAIVLVSQQSAPDASHAGAVAGERLPGIGIALVSGVAIGFFLLSLAQGARPGCGPFSSRAPWPRSPRARGRSHPAVAPAAGRVAAHDRVRRHRHVRERLVPGRCAHRTAQCRGDAHCRSTRRAPCSSRAWCSASASIRGRWPAWSAPSPRSRSS